MFGDVLLLLFLILVNGVFAMSEIAIVSSSRARLLQMADGGNAGAHHALALAAEPTRFLSSVQIGITTIGVLSGAVGGASIAGRLRLEFERAPATAEHAETLGMGVMVVSLTFISLILGELVPKRLALTRPEVIASLIARPVELLATLGRPFVRLLTASTDTVLWFFGLHQTKQPGVTLEDIRVMLEHGAEQGLVKHREHDMVRNVLNLDERHVGAVLTPRSDVVFLDVRDPIGANAHKLAQDPHGVLPLCDGGLHHVIGFVRSTSVLEQLLAGRGVDLQATADSPLFVPESTTLMKLLDQFKRTHLPIALVIDEFGDVKGLVSLTDVIGSIVGDLPAEPRAEPPVIRRDDGSWLLDGALDLATVGRTLEADSLVEQQERVHYHTLGGLAMYALARVPRTGDVFERNGYRFEIVDMDGNRVDRVLVAALPAK